MSTLSLNGSTGAVFAQYSNVINGNDAKLTLLSAALYYGRESAMLNLV